MFKFNNLSTARCFHYRMHNFSKFCILLGDDEHFWIVTLKRASQLLKQGYELVDA
jgi:hypothetical protein